MADIFISYAREDREAVEKLAALLEAAGLSCWWDKQLAAGARYRERTEIELNAAKAVLVVWTKNSVGSHWVADEAAAAQEAGKLAPISLDGVSPPLGFRQFQVIDFTGWKGGADGHVQELVATLAAFAPQAEIRNAPTKRGSSSGAIQRMRWPLGLAALVIALAAGLFFFIRPQDSPVPSARWVNFNSRAVDVSVPRLTLAVLKFDAPPGDTELEGFARAVSQTTADELIRDGLTVVAPSRTMELSAGQKAEAGKLFPVHALIDGNVSREGDRIRVGLRLDHAKQGITVWSSTIGGHLEEPAAAASRITAQLRQKLGVGERSSLLVSDHPQAAERARAWFRIIQLSDEGDDRGAMSAAEDFVRLWPNHSSPLFMLTIETMDALHALSDGERILAYREARNAAQESFRLRTAASSDGPKNAMADAMPAYAWGDRISALERIALDGQVASPNANYFHTGRIKLAHDRIGGGPFNSKTDLILRAEVHLARGETRLAVQELQNGAYIYPLHWRFPELRFESAAWLGATDEAEALLEKPGVWRMTEVQQDVLAKYVTARRTPRAKNAEVVAGQCASQATVRDDTALLYCLSALTKLGRIDEAFDAADVLFPELRPQPGDDPEAPRWLAAPAASWEPTVLYMPWTAPLRSDPRIILVFERMGLLEYWKSTGNWPDFCETEPLSVCAAMRGTRQ